MPSPNDNPIKITLEDLDQVTVSESKPEALVPVTGENKYGSIKTTEEPIASSQERASILLQGWFYLGIAGLVGALIGWGVCEPAFVDGGGHVQRWGNVWLIPIMVAMLCLSFGIAESVVERSAKKAAQRAAMSLPLGIIFGFILSAVANLIYMIGVSISVQAGAASEKNPRCGLRVLLAGWFSASPAARFTAL